MASTPFSDHSLYPPSTNGRSILALAISLDMAIFIPSEEAGHQKYSRTSFCDLDGIGPECFFQMARLLEEKVGGTRSGHIKALRMAADALEQLQNDAADEERANLAKRPAA